MLFSSFNRRLSKAFTLTEMAIAIAIMGLLLGAIWVATSSVNNKFLISHTTEQIIQIVHSVRNVHLRQRTLDPSLSALKLAKVGALPRDLLDDPTNPTEVKNVWGGRVLVETEDTKVFAVTFEDVPNEACAALLVTNSGVNRDRGLGAIGTGTGNFYASSMPISISDATAACSEGTNVLRLTFLLREKLSGGGEGGGGGEK